jgi:hypothetical protein
MFETAVLPPGIFSPFRDRLSAEQFFADCFQRPGFPQSGLGVKLKPDGKPDAPADWGFYPAAFDF